MINKGFTAAVSIFIEGRQDPYLSIWASHSKHQDHVTALHFGVTSDAGHEEAVVLLRKAARDLVQAVDELDAE